MIYLEDQLQEIRSLPVHSPLRILLIKEVLSDTGIVLDQFEREELENSISGVNFSDVILHYQSLLLGMEYKFLISGLFEKRDMLAKFYRKLKLSKQLELADIVSACENTIDTVEFWNAYYFVQMHLRINQIDVTKDIELCKRILTLEAEALKTVSSAFSSVTVERLYAFDIYSNIEQKAQISSMYNFLMGENAAIPIVRSTSIADSAKYKLIIDRREYVGKADVFFMLNEYLKDETAISYFGCDNVQTAIGWTDKYFKDVPTDDLLVSYFDYASCLAMNLAASGMEIDKAIEEVDKCVRITEKLDFYVDEGKHIKKYITERCEIIQKE